MPEKEKPTKDQSDDLALKEKRLERFTYDEKDLESLFNIQVKESAKNASFFKKKSLSPSKKHNK